MKKTRNGYPFSYWIGHKFDLILVYKVQHPAPFLEVVLMRSMQNCSYNTILQKLNKNLHHSRLRGHFFSIWSANKTFNIYHVTVVLDICHNTKILMATNFRWNVVPFNLLKGFTTWCGSHKTDNCHRTCAIVVTKMES